MGINWDSILAKAQAHMDTPKRKKEMEQKTGKILLGFEHKNTAVTFNLYDVGDLFAAELWRCIQASGFTANLEDRLADIQVGEPQDLGNGKYSITISWSTDLERSSMSTHKDYGYKVNLARLYNNGWSDTSHPGQEKTIYEWFHRVLYKSEPNIAGAHFAEDAIRNFYQQYKEKFHITDIKSEFDI